MVKWWDERLILCRHGASILAPQAASIAKHRREAIGRLIGDGCDRTIADQDPRWRHVTEPNGDPLHSARWQGGCCPTVQQCNGCCSPTGLCRHAKSCNTSNARCRAKEIPAAGWERIHSRSRTGNRRPCATSRAKAIGFTLRDLRWHPGHSALKVQEPAAFPPHLPLCAAPHLAPLNFL